MSGKELTPAQLERQDTVDNACHALLEELAGKELEWNMEHIGDVIDAVQDIICTELGIMTEMEFYPYIEEKEEWYFTVTSEEYGTEEYGSYDTEAEALEGIGRVKTNASELVDGVHREYSEPYKK